MRSIGWLLWLVPLCGLAGTPLPDAPHVVASGTGEVKATPDTARVSLDFRHRADAPLPAKQRVDAGVNRLLEALPTFAIAEKDVRASNLLANEEFDFVDGRRVPNGYAASRNVDVLLRDVGRLNALLDTALAAGATVGGVSYESSRAEQLRAEAKRRAVADARQEAAELARVFQAGLGPVYSINSLNSQLETYVVAEPSPLHAVTVSGSRAAAAPGRYLQPTVEYRESVRAVFELQR
ncbi:hypothetical protein EDC50_2030 [Vulcaniibacterium tengchongense]|uniref:Secreted protein n=2 Tax=Vulcaniibacterium tengchongense TaxID=1273429 RepID=A0A3N4VC52_9GAMM|nr:hypothetical protein EDC50_2030 [Vulcaniibacterium tengchongense]